jgi:hypothetical protein
LAVPHVFQNGDGSSNGGNGSGMFFILLFIFYFFTTLMFIVGPFNTSKRRCHAMPCRSDGSSRSNGGNSSSSSWVPAA